MIRTQDPRATRGLQATHADVVLDSDWYAGKPQLSFVLLTQRVNFVGPPQRPFAINFEERVQCVVELFSRIQRGFRRSAGSNFATDDAIQQVINCRSSKGHVG